MHSMHIHADAMPKFFSSRTLPKYLTASPREKLVFTKRSTMVKSYLRYEPSKSFGVVSTGNSNAIWLEPSYSSQSTSAGRALVGGLEDVLIWDIKTQTLLTRLKEGNKEVTQLAVDPTGELVAAGYSDGSIRVWDMASGTVFVTFNGHKSAVSALVFDSQSTRLVSGSRDSNIVVWDLVGEVGLYRLRSHRDQITGLALLNNDEWLVSVGKDGLLKLWDLQTQHCTETRVAHKGECWSLGVFENELVTCGTGKQVMFWQLDAENEEGKRLVERGTLEKQSNERGLSLGFDKSGSFLAVGNADKTVEIVRRRGAEEVKKSVQRKQKRRKDKGLDPDPQINENQISEIFIPYTLLRVPAKVRYVSWRPERKARDKVELLISLANNSIETYSVKVPESFMTKTTGPADYSRTYALDIAGHRSDIRAVSLSSDSKLVATASNGSLKVWNTRTGNCLRTVECGYALCASFLPGDSLVVVGTKAGTIELFDIGGSSLIETVEAHNGSLWSLDVSTDGKYMVSGGADKTVKFWEFRVVQEEVPGTTRTTPRMKLKHSKTLELSDDVLSVKLSPDGKYVAASLLDNTIKVFFTDSLKFFLNLYGHKLPVLSMDISEDNKLLVSCSADKNIKIWGLDFGDAHKSIFAHQDSIMKVVFEPASHNFFSVSKDKMLKYWDGDKFEQIQSLAGHHSEIWALDIARDGSLVVTGSHDRSIRTWEQTEEPLFIQEERENELEELYESNLLESLEQEDEAPKAGEDDEISEVARAGKQTIETLKAGERLIEALDIGVKDLDELDAHNQALKKNPKAAPPQRNVILAALDVSAERYVMDTLRKIPPSQLEDALLVFPFDKVISLFRFIEIWTAKRWNISLVCRVLFFALRTYHKQIVANKVMRTNLANLRDNLRRALYQERSQIGYNMAGLKFLKQNWEYHHHKEFLGDDEAREKDERQLKKRAFPTIQ